MKKFFPLCLILIVALVWTVSIAGNIDRVPTVNTQQEVENSAKKVKEVVVEKPLSGPEKPGYIDINAVEADEMTPEKAARIAEDEASNEVQSIINDIEDVDANEPITEFKGFRSYEQPSSQPFQPSQEAIDNRRLADIKADGIVTDAERAEANEILARSGYESDFPPVVMNQISETEPNDTCPTANPIACGDTVMCATLAFGTDNNDWYTFTLDNTYALWDVTIETYRIAAGECAAPDTVDINDTYLELWGSPCDTLIAFDDDGSPDGFFSLINASLPPGTYAINSDATHWGGQTGSYHLSLDCVDGTVTGCPGDSVTIDLQTDSYGSETSWVLSRAGDEFDTVASGSGYASNSSFTEVVCTEVDSCYDFHIYDSYGDGGAAYQVYFNGVLACAGTFDSGSHETCFGIGANCTVPTGRCCYGPDPLNPSCADNTQAECAALSGSWDATKTCAGDLCLLPGEYCENAISAGTDPNGYSDTRDSSPYADDYRWGGKDVVYTFDITTQTNMIFTTCNSPDSFRNAMWLYDDTTCGNTSGYLAFDTYTGGCGMAELMYDCAPGTYYLVMDASSTPPNEGTYTLEINQFVGPCDTVSTVPWNDSCQNVTPVTLTPSVPQVFTGNNCNATVDCGSFPNPHVWEAFTTTIAGDITLEYCGTPGGVWGNAYLNLAYGCPCTGFSTAASFGFTCADGNVQMTWAGFPAGTYYYPVMLDPGNGSEGDYTVTVTVTPPPPAPANDSCSAAVPVAVPSTTPGTTVAATIDDTFPTCVTTITAPGVWYSVTGTGNTMTASLCNGTATYDTKINVYCPDCGAPVCVTGNDDFCGVQSEASWCSEVGTNYLILVQGYNGATGVFDLVTSDDGTPCSNPVDCAPPPPTGRCCYNDGANCADNMEADCIALGGDWNEALNCVDNPCCPEDELIIEYTTDSWPTETSWELTDDATGDTIASVPAGGYSSSYTVYVHQVCVDSTGCYTLSLHDVYGDGGGSYVVILNGDTVATGTNSGYGSTVAGIGNGCATIPVWNCTDTPPDGKIAGGNIDIEPNDTCTTAQEALCEYAYCGDLSSDADYDWYRVIIPSDGTYGLHVRVFGNDTPNQYAQGGGLDSWVGIYGSDCTTLIASNDDYNGTFPDAEVFDSQIDPGGANCFQPGDTVYIEIMTPWSPLGGPYLLIINCVPCVIPTGACCVNEVCVATNYEGECDALGGTWNIDMDCATYVNCTPPIECDSTAIYQNGDWAPIVYNYNVTQCDVGYPLQFANADDFILPGTDSVNIQTVVAWTWNWNNANPGPSQYEGVNVTIYENDAQSYPGFNFPAGQPVNEDITCAHVPLIPGGIVYETTIDPGLFAWTDVAVTPDSITRLELPVDVMLAGGVQYWLEVQPVIQFLVSGQVGWMNSTNQTGEYAVQIAEMFGDSVWAPADTFDLAFCLYGPSVPVGRCCYTGLCADNTEAECAALGGTWDDALDCTNDPCPTGCDYVVGDVNGSVSYNGLDITYGVAFFKGGPDPLCDPCPLPPCDTFHYCGDVNASCSYNGLDITYGVAYFKGGPGPQPCPSCPPIGGPSSEIKDPSTTVIKTKPVFEQKPSLK